MRLLLPKLRRVRRGGGGCFRPRRRRWDACELLAHWEAAAGRCCSGGKLREQGRRGEQLLLRRGRRAGGRGYGYFSCDYSGVAGCDLKDCIGLVFIFQAPSISPCGRSQILQS
ncbi:hypothetical protein EJB05_36205 [Eragrostis curvula]|uniref:Uncharacterized protein n=1 Tax=Eragrostis curvula TaxID=38414 RepID=A0A5J9U8H8_9POAL|nr:hypothetical protein EJB05_36205 [Eragrostis curvula]